MRKILLVLTVLSVVVATSTTFAVALTVDQIVDRPGSQYWPSSNGTHLAYEEFLRDRYNAYVEPLSGPGRIRLNEPGASGGLGWLIADTDVVAFQQWWNQRSIIYLHDISTGATTRAPEPVHSPEWEYWPVASQRFMLFNRAIIRHRQVQRRALILVDRITGQQRVLISDLKHKTSFPGFVGDRYAAWTVCGPLMCAIWTYDADTDTFAQNPLPAGTSQYAPAIDEAAGMIYFVQSAEDRCGRNVKVRRAAIGGGGQVVIATLPPGIDTGWTLGLAPNGQTGFQDLYFERWNCQIRMGHIYAFRSVDAPMVPRVAEGPTGGAGVAQGWDARPPLPAGAP
jgi:hypothetical protein